MKELARPNVWMFVLLSLGISWGLLVIPEWVLPDSQFLPLIQVALYSWGPALAAIVMKKWVFSQSLKGMGWNRKYFDFRWIALTVFGPLGVVLGTLGLVFLLGNVLHVPGFGRVEIGAADSSLFADIFQANQLSVILEPLMAGIQMEFWTTVFILTVLMMVIGASLGLLFHLGAEMGFRGYLLKELQPLGFLGGNTVLGLMYGLWQSLLLLYFLPGWSDQFIPVFLSIFGFHLALAFPAAWLSIRTRSVYAPATFISVLNQLSGLTILFLWNSSPYLAGVNGMAGMIILMIATGAIMYFDRSFWKNYGRWVY